MASGKANMRVIVRIRPLSTDESSDGLRSCVAAVGGKVVAISKRGAKHAVLRSQRSVTHDYQFDAVFGPTATQHEVYESAAKPFVADLLDGYNATVFAYGATGAGKTHTMMGSERAGGSASGADAHAASEAVSGIIPCALMDVFSGVKEREGEGHTWEVCVSYLEVYNETVLDLLQPSGAGLKVCEDPARGVVGVVGLCEKRVGSASAVLELLREGNAHRKTEPTAANKVSSRSHAVLQVVVKHSERLPDGKKLYTESRLSLIDLAGSERASATQNRGARLQEGANINRSLLALANCINALSSARSRKNVNYRDSKLTHLLKTSLEGECKLAIVANLNPSHQMYEDTHNTLKYADRAKRIRVSPSLQGHHQDLPWPEREAALVKQRDAFMEQVSALKSQLSEAKTALSAQKRRAGEVQASAAQPSKRARRGGDRDSGRHSLCLSTDSERSVKDALRDLARDEELEALRRRLATVEREKEAALKENAELRASLKRARQEPAPEGRTLRSGIRLPSSKKKETPAADSAERAGKRLRWTPVEQLAPLPSPQGRAARDLPPAPRGSVSFHSGAGKAAAPASSAEKRKSRRSRRQSRIPKPSSRRRLSMAVVGGTGPLLAPSSDKAVQKGNVRRTRRAMQELTNTPLGKGAGPGKKARSTRFSTGGAEPVARRTRRQSMLPQPTPLIRA